MFNNNTSTGLCCLMERKCSVKCVLKQPSRFVNIIQCTYTNLSHIAFCVPRLHTSDSLLHARAAKQRLCV